MQLSKPLFPSFSENNQNHIPGLITPITPRHDSMTQTCVVRIPCVSRLSSGDAAISPNRRSPSEATSAWPGPLRFHRNTSLALAGAFRVWAPVVPSFRFGGTGGPGSGPVILNLRRYDWSPNGFGWNEGTQGVRVLGPSRAWNQPRFGGNKPRSGPCCARAWSTQTPRVK